MSQNNTELLTKCESAFLFYGITVNTCIFLIFFFLCREGDFVLFYLVLNC